LRPARGSSRRSTARKALGAVSLSRRLSERDDARGSFIAYAQGGRWAHGSVERAVEPYILPLDDEEKTAYQRLRIVKEAAALKGTVT
jgi:hypothetical protein